MKVEWKEISCQHGSGKALTVNGLPASAEWVAWEQAQYVPCLNVGGPWFTTEWMETGGVDPAGYNYEPIHDKKNQFSQVSVLDESSLHATLQWEYNLVNTLGKSFLDGTTSREMHTVHPSGVVARRLETFAGEGGYGGRATAWENFETIFLNPPGLSPVDYLDEAVATFMNTKGDAWDYVWEKDKFCAENPRPWRYLCKETGSSGAWDEIIVRIHLNGYPDVFAAFPQDQDRFPHHEVCPQCGQSHPMVFLWHDYPLWLHWPCYNDTDFVVDRKAKPADVHSGWTHSSVTSGGPFYDFNRQITWNPERGAKWHFLYGLAPKTDAELRDLVTSWLHPAAVSDPAGKATVSYDLGRMVYVVEKAAPGSVLEVQPNPVVVSPLFELKGWTGELPDVRVTAGDQALAPTVELVGDRLLVRVDETTDKSLQVQLGPR